MARETEHRAAVIPTEGDATPACVSVSSSSSLSTKHLTCREGGLGFAKNSDDAQTKAKYLIAILVSLKLSRDFSGKDGSWPVSPSGKQLSEAPALLGSF